MNLSRQIEKHYTGKHGNAMAQAIEHLVRNNPMMKGYECTEIIQELPIGGEFFIIHLFIYANSRTVIKQIKQVDIDTYISVINEMQSGKYESICGILDFKITNELTTVNIN